MQGVKRKRRCQNQCQQHLFSLKNLKNNSKYDIKLTFCPKYQRQPLPPQHTFAEYNNDGLFYTSAFVLGVDKKAIAKNLQKEMLDHQKLIKQNCQKYNQIVFPRPNSKHITCSVCKQTYKNYYQHIFSDEHGERIQLSPYNVLVKSLCQLYKDLWDGCAQKADSDAFNQTQRDRVDTEKRLSDQLNLDDILEQEDIDSNPSRISKYLQGEGQEQSQIKQVVMKRPARVYEPAVIQKPLKIYEDRQSRKKHINFAAFFDDQPKKKIINDHREPMNVSTKKMVKLPSLTETKSKQKIPEKKQQKVQEQQYQDPFIIQYNARAKKKQKKSYYYLKKKQREERQQRQRDMMMKQQNDDGLPITRQKVDENQQSFSDENQFQNQNQIQQSSQEEYERYLDKFHQDEEKNKLKIQQKKKTFSSDSNLFEQVLKKKPFIAPLFQSFANPIKNQQKLNSQKVVPSLKDSKIISPETTLLTSEVFSSKRPYQNVIRPPGIMDKKMNIDNKQKQSIIDKNKINYSVQNQLPLFHKFKNPLQKQIPRQNQIKTKKASHQVFNEYEQKIRQYQKQKDYNSKFKINPFQDKIDPQNSSIIQQTNVKISKINPAQQLQETYRYGNERMVSQQFSNINQIKTQPYNVHKYNTFSQHYYNKQIAQKQIPNPIPLNSLLPGTTYTNPNQFYSPYNYPISHYGYPLHDTLKSDRPPLKYGQQRENQSYQRGYYYGNWQQTYYMPPPGTIVSPQNTQSENVHKLYANPAFNPNKSEAKPIIYPGYPGGYSAYPHTNYPAYYQPPGTAFTSGQRPQFPQNSSNMRVPTQPNTSININFPMYVGSPYHSPYQYQHAPQRYPGQQQNSNPLPQPMQYIPSNANQSKQPGSQYNVHNSNGQNNLPPYAQYQQFKKRENERRR